MKRYSFIIPVYNCEAYIEKCVNRIVDINWQSFEILLINDGSTDNSLEICNRLAERNSNIRVISQKNSGVSKARNVGIDSAKGDYIIFIDADDTIISDEFRELLLILEDKNDYQMVIFGLSIDYYHKGKRYRKDKMFFPMEGIMNSTYWLSELYSLYMCNALSPVWNKVYDKHILQTHSIYFDNELFLYEDLEFVLRYLKYCDDIYCSKKVLYEYRQPEDEGNAKRRLKRVERISELVKSISDTLDSLLQTKIPNNKWIYENSKQLIAHLFFIMVSEKIAVSNVREISAICADFCEWYIKQDRKSQLEVTKYDSLKVQNILNNNTIKLFAMSRRNALRHKVVVAIKNSALYVLVKNR